LLSFKLIPQGHPPQADPYGKDPAERGFSTIGFDEYMSIGMVWQQKIM